MYRIMASNLAWPAPRCCLGGDVGIVEPEGMNSAFTCLKLTRERVAFEGQKRAGNASGT